MVHDERLDVVRGCGNVFRDFGDANADMLQMKAILAAQIIATLDERKLSVSDAASLTCFAAADFSKVRKAKMRDFSIDRLISIAQSLSPPRY